MLNLLSIIWGLFALYGTFIGGAIMVKSGIALNTAYSMGYDIGLHGDSLHPLSLYFEFMVDFIGLSSRLDIVSLLSVVVPCSIIALFIVWGEIRDAL